METPEHPFQKVYHSFLVRVWVRSSAAHDEDWEGEIHHLQGDRVYVFHGLNDLVERLLDLIKRKEAVDTEPREESPDV